MKTHQCAVNCAVTEICIQGSLFKKLGMTSPRGVDCMANSNATTSVQFPRSYPTSSRSCPPGWLVALYTTKRGWCTFWRLLNNGGWEDGRKVECFFLLLCTTTHTMEQRYFWSFLFVWHCTEQRWFLPVSCHSIQLVKRTSVHCTGVPY